MVLITREARDAEYAEPYKYLIQRTQIDTDTLEAADVDAAESACSPQYQICPDTPVDPVTRW